MKKRIVTAVITACLALCAAVWPQPDTREERPAPIPTHAAAAPKTDAVTTAERKNTETPRAEPDEELGAVPVPTPAELYSGLWLGTIRGAESPRVCRGYVRKWQ